MRQKLPGALTLQACTPTYTYQLLQGSFNNNNNLKKYTNLEKEEPIIEEGKQVK